jgi:hypothetical protein
MKKLTFNLLEDEFCINLQKLFRSNSCRATGPIYIGFVPKLKPKVISRVPSPMHLGAKENHIIRLEEFQLDYNKG